MASQRLCPFLIFSSLREHALLSYSNPMSSFASNLCQINLNLVLSGSAQLLLHGTDFFAWVVGGVGGIARVLWLLCSRCAMRDMGVRVLHSKHPEIWKMFTSKQAESKLEYKIMLY